MQTAPPKQNQKKERGKGPKKGSTPGLTAQMRLFASEYAKDPTNGTAAAIRAGYSPKTAQEQASRLLSKVMIQELVAQYQEKKQEKLGFTGPDAVATAIRLLKRAEEIGELGPAARYLELLFKHFGLFEKNNEQKKYSADDIQALKSRLAACGFDFSSVRPAHMIVPPQVAQPIAPVSTPLVHREPVSTTPLPEPPSAS